MKVERIRISKHLSDGALGRAIDAMFGTARGFAGRGRTRALIAYAHDVAMAAIAFAVAILLREGGEFLIAGGAPVWKGVVCFALVAAGVFWAGRLYRSLWCYVSLRDMLVIVRSATVTMVLFGPIYALSPDLSELPVETLAICWFVLVALIGGPRVIYRVLSDLRSNGDAQENRRKAPLLLMGAGDGTELFLRALARDPMADHRVVGIVDEMGTYLRRSIHGVEVLGALDQIGQVVDELDRRGERPERLVITEDNLSHVSVRALLDQAETLGLALSRIPRLTELRGGINDRVEVKPIAIEDLLGRPQTVLDRAGMAALCSGARVLVTGAGGTIGSELVRQIAEFRPAEITLVDNSELHLYDIDLELRERYLRIARNVVMADVRDSDRIREVFEVFKPDLVFHAAAMKHVPMVEMNPSEGVLTNVHGTRNVADACVAFGARAMVLISTDKAVNPTSVMGATKRVAESYCQALDIETMRRGEGGTRFFTVRFGNVLGSTGSVVPLFQRQLSQGGPLTVTHPHVTRYFMTTHEAVELVLQASALGSQSADQSGTIFVLEMGEPVRIQDMARQMIRLAGLRHGRDVDIVFTGLRPGEKLYEEPLHASEELKPTEVRGILLAAPRTADYAMLCRLVDELVKAALARDAERAISLVCRLVPEYIPTENANGGLEVVAADGVDDSPSVRAS